MNIKPTDILFILFSYILLLVINHGFINYEYGFLEPVLIVFCVVSLTIQALIFGANRAVDKLFFLITPILMIGVLASIFLYTTGELREFEASDSYVYDRLASLLALSGGSPDGLDGVKYGLDDYGYPLIRYLFGAEMGSNIALLFFKILLHYSTAYFIYVSLLRDGIGAVISSRCSLLYLNNSILIFFVCSGLKEVILAFFVSGLLLNRLWIKSILISCTYFFRKTVPLTAILALITLKYSRFLSTQRLLVILSILLFLTFVFFVNISSNSFPFRDYMNLLLLGYELEVFFASLYSVLFGGIPTVFNESPTNLVYSPSVFLVNCLLMGTLFSLRSKYFKEPYFYALLIFGFGLIVLALGIKVRYIAPFYFIYMLIIGSSFSKISSTGLKMGVIATVFVSQAWSLLA